jgi:3-deoxy-D-arabino-heptulosonate 7-phosphate (DAHP) synthase class II
MEIHKQKGTILGGVHLELTGEVNEDGYSVVGPDGETQLSPDGVHRRFNGTTRQGPLVQLPNSL